jgi:carboxymethylenebutenolidase
MAHLEQVLVPVAEGRTMRAVFAVPEVPVHRGPAVIAIHDIMGFTPDIRRIAGRLADAGYMALAPDLYDAEGSKVMCVMRTLRALRSGEGPAFTQLEAARSWLSEHQAVDSERIGVMGFCMGGGFALMFAERAPLAVAAPFYGDVPRTADGLRNICPVVAGYGERDKMFVEQGRRLVSHLGELGVANDIEFYPGVGHSFMNDHKGVFAKLGRFTPMRAGYDEAAAEDSWSRVFAFFSKHL